LRLVRAHDLQVRSGVLVTDLAPGGPAALGGLERGDVVVGVAGHPVSGSDDLHRLLAGETIGQDMAVEVLRGAALRTLSVRPVEAVA
jgi:serine protease Do